ncbi:hypothetical protein OR606_10280, partial [Aeromonas hydrophila]|uniref:hypothetical protein n=2 Tax=Aeromonadaceae TaxID=84642 RepID=UPI00224EFB0B
YQSIILKRNKTTSRYPYGHQRGSPKNKESLFMGLSDHEYVNFSQEHELNYHLQKVNKAESIANRATLVTMGEELKKKQGTRFVTHIQFHEYIKSNLNRLANKAA